MDESAIALATPSEEIMAVHEALELLAADAPLAADLVKLRYFVGMTIPEAAEALDLTHHRTERLWTFARAWLRHAMDRANPGFYGSKP